MPAFLPFELVATAAGETWEFVPFTRNNGVFTFMDTTQSDKLDLRPIVTLSTSMPSKTSKVMKVRAKLTYPVESTTLPGTFSHSVSADVTFICPQVSTSDERSTLLEMMQVLLRSEAVGNAIANAEPVY